MAQNSTRTTPAQRETRRQQLRSIPEDRRSADQARELADLDQFSQATAQDATRDIRDTPLYPEAERVGHLAEWSGDEERRRELSGRDRTADEDTELSRLNERAAGPRQDRNEPVRPEPSVQRSGVPRGDGTTTAEDAARRSTQRASGSSARRAGAEEVAQGTAVAQDRMTPAEVAEAERLGQAGEPPRDEQERLLPSGEKPGRGFSGQDRNRAEDLTRFDPRAAQEAVLPRDRPSEDTVRGSTQLASRSTRRDDETGLERRDADGSLRGHPADDAAELSRQTVRSAPTAGTPRFPDDGLSPTTEEPRWQEADRQDADTTRMDLRAEPRYSSGEEMPQPIAGEEIARRDALRALPVRSVAEQAELDRLVGGGDGLGYTRRGDAGELGRSERAPTARMAARDPINMGFGDAASTERAVARATAIATAARADADAAANGAKIAADAVSAMPADAADADARTELAKTTAAKAAAMADASAKANASVTAAAAHDVAAKAAMVAAVDAARTQAHALAAADANTVDAGAKMAAADAADAKARVAADVASKAAFDAVAAATASDEALANARAPAMTALDGGHRDAFFEMKEWVRAEMDLASSGHSVETRRAMNP